MITHEDDRIYLDHAAATPLRADIAEAMAPYWREEFGNPQSVHREGQTAHAAIARSRERIADTLAVQAAEIVFTSGATESNSLALIGLLRAAHDFKPTILFEEIAHTSIRSISTSYEDQVVADSIPPTAAGRLDMTALKDHITNETIAVSVSHANSEIGTLQPVRDVSTVLSAHRDDHARMYPLLHVDASQSGLYESLQPERLGADLLTINPQKLGGPKGVGVLWVRSGTPLAPLFLSSVDRQLGDYQQLRAGTPPVPLIVGAAKAISWAQEHRQEHAQSVSKLRDDFMAQIETAFPTVRVNGSRRHRIAHNVSVTFPAVDHDYLAARLDAAGIAAATTSACQARRANSDTVVSAVTGSNEALRFSLGTDTTKEELERVVAVLKELLA